MDIARERERERMDETVLEKKIMRKGMFKRMGKYEN